MKLYLVRHTKVDVKPGTCYGQSDVPLMPSFPEEADAVKTKLDGIIFTHCFSSPLTRCRLLAKVIIPEGLSISFDDRLKELDFGAWEGKVWDQFHQSFDAKKWFDNYMETPCPGGESFFQLIDRVRSFLNDLAKLPNNATVLIVSHGGPIRAFLTLINKIDPLTVFNSNIENGEVIILKMD